MPDINSIRNIIFDLGGVILNIDPNVSVQQMQKLGIRNFDQLYSLFKQHEIFDKLEKGQLSEEEFVQTIREYSGTTATHKQIIDSWNSLLLDYPREHIELLKELNESSGYRTFLLSNTNQIHKDKYTQTLQEEFQIDGLEDLFEKAYFSHEIGMRKPDPEIFRFVLEDSQLQAEETLFIDDSEVNIESAQKLGIKTWWVNGSSSITELFPKQ